MKKLIQSKALLFVFVMVSFILLAMHNNLSDSRLAKVKTVRGVNIFMYSEPVGEFEYLGTIKISLAITGQPKEMINMALNKLAKQFPQANGIMFTDDQMEKADAIKIKTE